MSNNCQRCWRMIHTGDLFYHVKLSSVSGYDGTIDDTEGLQVSRLLDDISKRSVEDLEMDVYFEREVILCHACRTAVIDLFCAEVGVEVSPDGDPGNHLH